jgi:hypothetical protein
MAGAQAQTVSPSLLRSGGNALLGNQGGGGGLSQPILSSLATRRSQFGGVNMLGIAKRLCDDVLSIGTVLGTTCIIPLVMNV